MPNPPSSPPDRLPICSPDRWTISGLIRWTQHYFADRGIEAPRAAAEILLAHVLGVARIDLYLRHDQPLNDDELGRFKALIKRRVQREPVAYIVGEKEFWGLALAVSSRVLIPRPDTESLVETVLNTVLHPDGEAPKRVLELGVGSGAIVIALATERPDHHYFAADCSTAALAVTRANLQRHGLADRVRLFAGNWLDPVGGRGPRFDLIVSNPPYIPSRDLAALAPEIRRYEPTGALDGGEQGLDAIRRILGAAYRHLAPGGHLVLEIGHDQAETVCRAAGDAGPYAVTGVARDYAGHDRVVHLTRLGEGAVHHESTKN
jgi:release factor glutamine methyltransferase